jgi:hypothetical protein
MVPTLIRSKGTLGESLSRKKRRTYAEMDTLEARGVVAGSLLLATNVPISAIAAYDGR